MKEIVKKNILGVDLTDGTSQEILEYIFDFLDKTHDTMYITTPNPEAVMYSRSHESFRDILNGSGISLCDGVGLFKAAKFLGKVLPERITGTDFMEILCRESVGKPVSIGFLGARKGVAEKAAECLMAKYPGLKVAFVSDEWSLEGFERAKSLNSSSERRESRSNDERSSRQARTISGKESSHTTKYLLHDTDTIDILFVAYGVPKQEEWMAEHSEKLPVRIMMGVGGAFDYFSGEVGRAPEVLRNVGLEWLYRLIRQPWRLKRQLALPKFMLLVLKERFK